jgi:hypothetical protein
MPTMMGILSVHGGQGVGMVDKDRSWQDMLDRIWRQARVARYEPGQMEESHPTGHFLSSLNFNVSSTNDDELLCVHTSGPAALAPSSVSERGMPHIGSFWICEERRRGARHLQPGPAGVQGDVGRGHREGE